MKKIFSAFMLSILLFTNTSVISAEDAINEFPSVLEMIDYLESNGFPEGILENKENSYIRMLYEKLYNIDFVYNGITSAYLNETDPSGVSVMGAIPENELEFSVTTVSNVVYDTSVGMNRVVEVYVFLEYEWAAGHPIVRKEDAVTVNWDPDVFTYDGSSFSAVDRKLSVLQQDWITTDTYTRPAHSNQGGIGFYTNLAYTESVMGQTTNAAQCRGEASLTLKPADPMYTVTGQSITSINCEYVHDYSLPPFALGFSSPAYGYGVSIEIPLVGTDSASCTTNFYYKFVS